MTDMQLLWLSIVAVIICAFGMAMYMQTLLFKRHVPEAKLALHQKMIAVVTMALLVACGCYAMYIWVNRPAAKVRVPVSKIEVGLPNVSPINIVPSIQAALLTDVQNRMLDTRQLHCLALNIYHEARGENYEATVYGKQLTSKELVAEVTLYRAHREHTTLCSVVYEPNQFSWTVYNLNAKNRPAFNEAKELARKRVMEYIKGKQPLKVSHFHAMHVRPAWATRMKPVADVGNHRFWYNEG